MRETCTSGSTRGEGVVPLCGIAPSPTLPPPADPVQAGVMAVMAVADTAKFTLDRLKRRIF